MILATKFWEILCELAPWFLVGAVLAGLLHGLAPLQFVRKRLQGYQGVFWASLFGIPLPLCSCAVIPTGIGLRKSGAGEGASVGFLISTPQTGIDSILVTAAFLGWPFAIFKMVVALVLGTIAGFIIEFRQRRMQARITEKAAETLPKRKSLALPVIQSTDAAEAEVAPTPAAPPATASGSVFAYVVASLRHGNEIIRSIYVWILLGVLISAVLTTFIPLGAIQTWLGPHGTWLQAPLSLLISIPLYVCATASVPIAAALVNGGLSVGATVVFLMAGPATNLATIGAIYRSFSRFAFATYLLTVVLGSVAAAFAFDWYFASSLGDGLSVVAEDAHGLAHAHAHDHGHDATSWLNQITAGVLLVLFAWYFAEQTFIAKWLGFGTRSHHDHH